ncbi:MAG: FtsH protease activity modulator HflK [Gammaproteobacteria bacterium]|jgi:modulator of FtsH protease HflK
MAWNEPGGDKRDPWGGGNKQDGPPDLDEVIRNLQKKLGGLFGKKGGGGGSKSGKPMPGSGLIGIVLLALLILYAGVKGFYIVGPAERGVETRFGAFKRITMPGPNWRLPEPFESHTLVNVDDVTSFKHKAQMLTSDENIVEVSLNVQYRINNPQDFLFRDHDPRETIRSSTESALREVVGQNTLDDIITENRNAIAVAVKQGIVDLVSLYKTGLEVVRVNIQDAEAPPAVKEAFDDVIKAREDKERFVNKAEEYANKIIPQARGEAEQRKEDARAYKARVIAEAEGESQRFMSLLTEYTKAPQVTRERLYLETVERVFSDSSKVLLDIDNSNNLTYLPLDRMISDRAPGAPSINTNQPPSLEAQRQQSREQQSSKDLRQGRDFERDRTSR